MYAFRTYIFAKV